MIPTLSVIITSYNKANTLEIAIQSVLKYIPNNVEIIIVDDGSTDGSSDIIMKYHDRARIFLNEHMGMMRTYDFAFKQIRGEFFKFCDCDDYWIGRIDIQLDFMRKNNLNFTITKGITDNGKEWINAPLDQVTFDKLLIGKAYIFAQTYMIRTSKFREYIQFEKFLKFHTWDFPIVAEWLQHEPIIMLNIYTAVYVKNEESTTNTRSRLKRLKYIVGSYRTRLYFIMKYGCKFSTIIILTYRFFRHLLSILLKRWK